MLGDDYFAQYIYEECKIMGLSPRRLKSINVEGVDKSKDFVLVPVYGNHKEYFEQLSDSGLTCGIDFSLMNTSGYCRAIDRIGPFLGYARNNSLGDIQQYDRIGDGKVHISIYGSSTSDLGEAGLKCWPVFTYEYLKNNGVDTTIYCGAVAGYSSGQEALKLFRDICVVDSDYIISFSGGNDIESSATLIDGYPYVNKYQNRTWEYICANSSYPVPDSLDMRGLKNVDLGPKDKNEDYEIWINNQKKMYAVCSEYKKSFISILEPLIAIGGRIEGDLSEIIHNSGISQEYFENQNEFRNKVLSYIDKLDYMYDMSGFFSTSKELFLYARHYNEEGHKLVGEAVARIIMKNIDVKNS